MKNPDRKTISRLVDLPNIGRMMAYDVLLIGIDHPKKLIGKDPFRLYEELCAISGQRMILVLLMCSFRLFVSWNGGIRFLGGHLPMNVKKIT